MGSRKRATGSGKQPLQQLEKQLMLGKIKADILRKKAIIETAIACHYSDWNINRKKNELEELIKEYENVARA